MLLGDVAGLKFLVFTVFRRKLQVQNRFYFKTKTAILLSSCCASLFLFGTLFQSLLVSFLRFCCLLVKIYSFLVGKVKRNVYFCIWRLYNRKIGYRSLVNSSLNFYCPLSSYVRFVTLNVFVLWTLCSLDLHSKRFNCLILKSIYFETT